MKINLTSVMVDDQQKALRFYTEVLGFVKEKDVPVGEFRWLTVSSPEGVHGVELLLEPSAFPPARAYQQALREAGIPATSFAVENMQAEYERLRKLGVEFTSAPTQHDWGVSAVFNDTCGNLIALHQSTPPAR
jgi:predicted enzyme related to lactoylglutathione lyase